MLNKDNEYYLYFNRDQYIEKDGKLELKMFVPNDVKNLYVDNFSSDDKLIKRKTLGRSEDIILSVNVSENNYYNIYSDDKELGNIKVYVYLGGE